MQDREDVITCLVTGNLQPIGWAKMEALGIKHLFSEPFFGGFGSDYCNPDNSEQSWKDRAELVKIAAEKAQKHFPGVHHGNHDTCPSQGLQMSRFVGTCCNAASMHCSNSMHCSPAHVAVFVRENCQVAHCRVPAV